MSNQLNAQRRDVERWVVQQHNGPRSAEVRAWESKLEWALGALEEQAREIRRLEIRTHSVYSDRPENEEREP